MELCYPPTRVCLARTPHPRQYSLVTRIEIEAHREVLVFINGVFELVLERLDCRTHAAPTMSSQLTWSACDHLARSPGERIAEFAARVKQRAVACKFTAGDRQLRLEDRFISGLRDWEMISALLQREDEGVIFNSAVGAASAAGRTLEDVRALAGQNMTGDPKVRAMYQAPTTARTVFGAGRGPTLQRGQSDDDVNTQGHLQRVCRMSFAAIKVMNGDVRDLHPVRGNPSHTGHDLQPVRCFVHDVRFYVPGQDLRPSRGNPDDPGARSAPCTS